MEVLILVCALNIAAPDCQRDTAISKFYAPEPQTNYAGCMVHGMQFAAQSRMVKAGTYPKIFCVPFEAPKEKVARSG